MPPLVDNPFPPASMTYTFAANMTPITYNTEPNAYDVTQLPPPPRSFIYSPQPETEVECPDKRR